MKHYPMDKSEARCRPNEHCPDQNTCLRFRAPMPLQFGSVMDGMVERRNMLGMLTSCTYFVPLPDAETAP